MSNDSLRFPSGKSVEQLKKDAKRLVGDRGIPHHEALDQVAASNGMAMSWAEAVAQLAGAASTGHVTFPLSATDGSEVRLGLTPERPVGLVLAGPAMGGSASVRGLVEIAAPLAQRIEVSILQPSPTYAAWFRALAGHERTLTVQERAERTGWGRAPLLERVRGLLAKPEEKKLVTVEIEERIASNRFPVLPRPIAKEARTEPRGLYVLDDVGAVVMARTERGTAAPMYHYTEAELVRLAADRHTFVIAVSQQHAELEKILAHGGEDRPYGFILHRPLRISDWARQYGKVEELADFEPGAGTHFYAYTWGGRGWNPPKLVIVPPPTALAPSRPVIRDEGFLLFREVEAEARRNRQGLSRFDSKFEERIEEYRRDAVQGADDSETPRQ